MAPSRRDFLRTCVLPVAVALAGCSGSSLCIGQSTIEIRAESATPSDSEKESINPIVFSELSEGEKEVARTAIEDGYNGCSSGADRFVDRVAHRQEAVGGDFITVYLKRGSEYYSLSVRSGDAVYSSM